MKVGKLKPSYSQCISCVDIHINYNEIEDCAKCRAKDKEVEILQIGTGFWSGTYAFILVDGTIEKVSIDRLYNIREV